MDVNLRSSFLPCSGGFAAAASESPVSIDNWDAGLAATVAPPTSAASADHASSHHQSQSQAPTQQKSNTEQQATGMCV